jgi:small subunit ribosomal protein S1
LSRKQTLADPWHTATEKYPEEKVFSGKVNKLMTYGAFVELEPGLEGLIHISAMGAGRRLKHPKEMVTEGQNVDVKVLSVDPTARRISLELVPERTEGTDAESIELEPGQVVAGEVDSLQDYGVFVNLPNGKTGLLHISEIQGVRREDFKRRFRVGDSIQVEVLEIASGGDRISLSTKSIETRKESSNLAHYQSTAGDSGSFGTLGDLLKDKIGR